MRRAVLASVGAAAVMAGGAMTAAPANAAPVITGGLVNVTVTNLLNNNTVQAANGITVQAAAVLCGTTVQVLVADLGPDGVASDCDANQNTETTVTQRRG